MNSSSRPPPHRASPTAVLPATMRRAARTRYRTPRVALGAAALLVALAAGAQAPAVRLDYRLQPDRDQVVEMVNESITTVRVVEDRGIVAKSQGRLSAAPVTFHLVDKRRIRYTTGPARPDGSFVVAMEHLERQTRLQGLDGSSTELPDRTGVQGLKARGTLEADGSLRAGSIELEGGDPAFHAVIGPVLESTIQQAAKIAPLALDYGKSVPQDMSLQIPMPGLGPLKVDVRIANQLLSVDDGVARIQLVYSMDFGTPASPMQIEAEGTGGGMMRYDLARRTLLSSEGGMLIRMRLTADEGVLEFQFNAKDTQTTQQSATARR